MLDGDDKVDPARFPLPEGVPDATVNKGELAEAFAVSETTVDKWMRKPGFPVLEGGQNGVAYKFLLSDVWAWREAGRERERVEKAATSDAVRQLRMLLLNVDDGSEAAQLGPNERRAEYAAEAQYLVTARQRREVIPTVDVIALLESIFGLVRDGLDAQPDRIARELGLDGASTEKLVALNDELLGSLRSRIVEMHGAAPTDRLV